VHRPLFWQGLPSLHLQCSDCSPPDESLKPLINNLTKL
jgi:hypothetical protein